MSLDVPSTIDSGDKPKCGQQRSVEFEWARNSRNQDPCEVAWFLVQNPQCDLNILVNSTSVAEVAPEDNPCLCSSTIYSLVSACRLCQDGDQQLRHPTWEFWKRNCTNSTGESVDYPFEIPGGTAVPHWAYLSFDGRPGFDAGFAEADARTNPPESTPPSVPTQTSISSDNQSTESAAVPVSGASASKSLVGPIVGGVVGGVALIAIIVALLVFFIRRRQHNIAPSAAYMRAHGGKLPTYRESLQGGVFPLRSEKGADMIENNSYSSDRPIRPNPDLSEQSFVPYHETSPMSSPVSEIKIHGYTGGGEPGSPYSFNGGIGVVNR
uniref:Uncharacterized protein n=1 Tax=Moniliophthora roreri TaxID=221103 RepID=A0A0W0FLA3_MONRR